MKALLERLQEKGTWAAVAGILAAVGVSLPPGVTKTAVLAVSGASAVAAVIIKEGWKKALESGDAADALEQRVAQLEAQKPAATGNPNAKA